MINPKCRLRVGSAWRRQRRRAKIFGIFFGRPRPPGNSIIFIYYRNCARIAEALRSREKLTYNGAYFASP